MEKRPVHCVAQVGGEPKGAGKDVIVYPLEKGLVAKFDQGRTPPHRRKVESIAQVKHWLAVFRGKFGQFLIDTRIAPPEEFAEWEGDHTVGLSEDEARFAIVQESLPEFRELKLADLQALENEHLRQEFIQIVGLNRELMEEQDLCVDFWGASDFLHFVFESTGDHDVSLGNLAVVKDEDGVEHIRMFDFYPVEKRKDWKARLIAWVQCRMVRLVLNKIEHPEVVVQSNNKDDQLHRIITFLRTPAKLRMARIRFRQRFEKFANTAGVSGAPL